MTTYEEVVTPGDWLCENCGGNAQTHGCGITRRRRKFVAMLRIKNEAERIAQVLHSVQPLCDELFVFDDHSTDDTAAIVQAFEHVHYFPSPFAGLNESRDKNYLYDRIIEWCEPEWILCVDGDEVLEDRGPDIIRAHTASNPEARAFRLKIAFMWDQPDLVRVDRIYNDFWRPSLFRPFVPRPHVPDDMRLVREFRFMSTPFGRATEADKPNLHCSSVPQRLIHGARICPVRLKHYGYMERDQRVRKLDYYNAIDWLNASEDCYRHMTQGDNVQMHELPRVAELVARGKVSFGDMQSLAQPSYAKLLHAGPREIARWDENEEWEPTAWAKAL